MQRIQEFKYFDVFPVVQVRWDNGFEAFLVHNPTSPVVAYLTQYTVGSAQEQERQRGLAHFFEHMMFRETASLKDGDMDRIFAEAGGVGLNASTSYDCTQYYVNVPTAHLERVIALEADRMMNLRLSPDLIEKERGAVLGEMGMYKDMPSDQLSNALMAAAFARHPYRHPIIGYTEQVQGFQLQDFAGFYRQHYAPNRALVTVAGGFDEEQVLRLLERAYAGLPPGTPRPAPVAPDPLPGAPKRTELTHDKISTEYLLLATRTPGLTHPDTVPLVVLSAVLSAGRSSPLHRRLVLSGLATSAGSTVMDTEYPLVSPGLFLFDVSLRHGVRAEQAEAAVDGLLAELRQGIPALELQRAKNQLRLGTLSSLQTNMGLARQIGGYYVACGNPRFAQQLLERALAVTEADLLRVLNAIVLAPGRCTVIQRPASQSAAA
ncbi:MAG TPA: pitrilysin family protein [bacterium]|nr:pitrilysin family protein [bacterium]